MTGQKMAVSQVKVSVFLRRYFPDHESRPCAKTIVKQIQQGKLSGQKIGGLWFVACTEWGQPLHWNSQSMASNHAPIVAKTGNRLADKIIKQHFGAA